ncbi:MAG: tetratricopeptide (TPR) repeat protein [Verrucomicrobiales bacterium]|jgi:tetratricopeptide (TPR) repeat protein
MYRSSCEVGKGLLAAQGYYQLGMTAESQSALDALPDEDRRQPHWFELSILLQLESKDYSTVLDLCETTIRLFPNIPSGYLNKAFVLHELGRIEEALKVIEDSHCKFKGEPIVAYRRACFLACLRRYDEAIVSAEMALLTDPRLYHSAMQDPDFVAIRHYFKSK